MGYYINPPADGFEAVLNYKKYVDKSGLIAYINSVLNTPDMLTCSTRPRRFGKSFAAKMLAAYYSKGAESKVLFEKLEIAGLEEERRKETPDKWERVCFEENLNKYDVLFLDITSFISMAEDIGETVCDIQGIKENISRLYR